MSLLNVLKKKNKVTLFTTPSHSQKFFILSKFRQFYKYDISETDAYNPQKALESAEKKAAKIYGTKSTHFLTNGSTSGIIAAVLSFSGKNDKILIWNNAHQSHKNAVRLAGAEPVFYEVDKNKDWGIYGETSPEKLEKIFQNDKIKAVIVTSPTYEGIISDIKAIKKICSKHNVFLIIDEAHGALYPFCKELPESAIYKGADFVIQSLHKTAGGLNPTAVLHCNIDSDIKSALDLISTTSPSYTLLAGIEKNINYLNSKKGRKKISELVHNIKNMKKNITNVEFYSDNDPTKILVKSAKLNGCELSEFLFKKNIEDEKTNEISTMLLCGLGTDLKKITRLEKILKLIP